MKVRRHSGAKQDFDDAVLTASDAHGKTANFSYDTLGNLTMITDALSHTTQMTHDARGRLRSVVE